MPVVTLSKQFRFTMPKEVRQRMKLRPKDKIVVIEKSGRMVLVPLVPLKSLKGSLKGLTTRGLREH